jgi:hypothetical protein
VFQSTLSAKTLTNKNDIHDEIRAWINYKNAHFRSVPKLFPPRSLSKTQGTHNTNFASFYLYGCDTWSITWADEHTRIKWSRCMQVLTPRTLIFYWSIPSIPFPIHYSFINHPIIRYIAWATDSVVKWTIKNKYIYSSSIGLMYWELSSKKYI